MAEFEKAELYLLRAIDISEKVLGGDLQVATSSYTLAEVYRVTSRYEEAEAFYLRTIRIRESTLGSDHPGVAEGLNLGTLYVAMGLFEKAEPLYVRALSIREKAFPPDHPRTEIRLMDDSVASAYCVASFPQSDRSKTGGCRRTHIVERGNCCRKSHRCWTAGSQKTTFRRDRRALSGQLRRSQTQLGPRRRIRRSPAAGRAASTSAVLFE